MPQTPAELSARYRMHAVAMGESMKQAETIIHDESQSDHTPKQLLDIIQDVQTILSIAQWHAERMRVYERLMNSAHADRDPQTIEEALSTATEILRAASLAHDDDGQPN